MSNYLDAIAKNKGVIIVGVHFMSLELGGRIMGLCFPVNAMYRPHNNKSDGIYSDKRTVSFW